jgi:hypothetical protein
VAEDVGDPKQVKIKKTKHKLTREQELEELRALVSTAGGRAFLWRLLATCKISTFGFCGDNDYLNNLEGRRSVGAWVIEEVDEADPRAYSRMRDEAASRDAKLKLKGETDG